MEIYLLNYDVFLFILAQNGGFQVDFELDNIIGQCEDVFLQFRVF